MGNYFEIGSRKLKSRLFIGTGKLPTYRIIPDIIKKNGSGSFNRGGKENKPSGKGGKYT